MDKAHGGYDFLLVVISVLLLATIGVLFLAATAYGWWQSLGDPAWSYGLGYGQFVELMNKVLAPLLIMLIIMLGLCLPKRLWSKLPLLAVNIVFLIVAAIASILFDAKEGLRVFIIICLILQGVVIGLTFLARGNLRFELEGFYSRLGSSVLHFAFVALSADFAVWPDSGLHLHVFWVSTFLLVIGSAMSFYGSAFSAASKLFRKRFPTSGH